jgi:ribosomal-protein-alanine N-acetyltransferase
MKIPSILTTKRLILRPFSSEDFKVFCELLEIKQFRKGIKFDQRNNASDVAKNWLNSIIKSYNSKSPIFSLLITHGESNACLGSCGLTKREDFKVVRCYYILFPKYWGNGYAIEAIKKLFEYAFLDLHLTKLEVYITSGNNRGWKAAERAGMKYLGDVINKNTSHREMLFTIEKKEFERQITF